MRQSDCSAAEVRQGAAGERGPQGKRSAAWLRPSLLPLLLGGMLCTLAATAQTSAPAAAPSAVPALQPLQALPHTPVLDVASVDKSVDPCVDFYQYSCGNWRKNNPIPADQASWSVYAKLANENQQFLWGILRDASTMKGRTPPQVKIGDYFAACIDEKAVEAKGLAPVQPMLARVDAYATRDALLHDLPMLSHDAAMPFFFRARPAQDPNNANQVIAQVGPGGLGLPDRDFYVKQDAKSIDTRAHYTAYLETILTMAGEPAAQAKSDAAGVLAMETALAKASLTRVERRDPYKVTHKMDFGALQAMTPAVQWTEVFRVQGTSGGGVVNVEEPALMAALESQMADAPLPVLKAYLRVRVLTSAAPELSQPWQNAQFAFYGTYLRGTPSLAPRWKRCTRQVDTLLGDALGEEFVRRTFSANTRAKTQLMTRLIEDAMKQEIEQLDWMSAATKTEALHKLAAIRNKVGYPDRWRDYSALEIRRDDYFGNYLRASQFEQHRQFAKIGRPVDRDEWGMTPPTVNAYFNPQMNDINFPAGVLQPPLYDGNGDDAPNYGNTGATIGHELTHAFDDQGRQFDANGNLRDWWTKEDAKQFEDHINCLRDQYATYTVVDDIHINAKLTSGEDVADLGGTLIAYLAWKKATEGQTLTPIDGYTPEQRFFVGFGQWACENTRPENLRVTAVTDPHSPGFARINGIATNLPEFAKAFGCKAGQPMVKQNVCKVW